jgi:hypothetical protein
MFTKRTKDPEATETETTETDSPLNHYLSEGIGFKKAKAPPEFL